MASFLCSFPWNTSLINSANANAFNYLLYFLHLDDCSHPLYAHLNIGIQISEKRALLLSGIEPGSAAYKAPDTPMCQITPHLNQLSLTKI